MDNALTLHDLHDHIRRVFLLNFEEEVWVKAEISSHNERKGHHYLTLIQQDDSGQVVASAQAMIWQRNFMALINHHGDTIYSLLSEGMQVQVQCRVNFDTRYGYSLQITNVDLEYTFGELYLQRLVTIEKLHTEMLWDLQREIPLLGPLQKVAVLSSRKAAGWADFKEHLFENPFGLIYKVDLFHVAVQGVNAVSEIVAAMKRISEIPQIYDAVIILRGGGSKLDLIAFDDFAVAEQIALCPLPVITAIGHEIDESVADLVAAHPVKTPTAAADYLVQTNLNLLAETQKLMQEIQEEVLDRTDRRRNELTALYDKIQVEALGQVSSSLNSLKLLFSSLRNQTEKNLLHLENHLLRLDKICQSYSPDDILSKGFAVVNQGEKWIHSLEDYDPKQSVQITLHDGKIQR